MAKASKHLKRKRRKVNKWLKLIANQRRLRNRKNRNRNQNGMCERERERGIKEIALFVFFLVLTAGHTHFSDSWTNCAKVAGLHGAAGLTFRETSKRRQRGRGVGE